MTILQGGPIDEKETKLLQALRTNARTSLLALAKQLGMPSSTVHQKVQRYQGSVIIKHTSLLDFRKLGYVRAYIAIKTLPAQRTKLAEYLASHSGVNNLQKIDSGFDFFVEVIGKDQKEIEDFAVELKENHWAMEVQKFTVIEDVRREKFVPREI